jgi:hypothetical protein
MVPMTPAVAPTMGKIQMVVIREKYNTSKGFQEYE